MTTPTEKPSAPQKVERWEVEGVWFTTCKACGSVIEEPVERVEDKKATLVSHDTDPTLRSRHYPNRDGLD